MNPTTAATWGFFIQATYDQFMSNQGQTNPAVIKNMPAGYTLVRTIQMTDFFGPEQTRVFYGFIAVGGKPKTVVIALRGTATNAEWWDDLHWELAPFSPVSGGGNVAQGFLDNYSSLGTMNPNPQKNITASGGLIADISNAITENFTGGLSAGLPIVVCGHSLGGALATLLAMDLAANTPLKPQVWTFGSPKVGDAVFAGRFNNINKVSWRIYNQPDVVPSFPVDVLDNYQHVATGYAVNSFSSVSWSLGCSHALNTYMHMLLPSKIPLDPSCKLAV